MADVSVRAANESDVADIARVQLATWRIGYASILPAPVLAGLAQEQATRAWAEALRHSPSQRHHILVALEQAVIVGFAAVAPAADAEADDPEPDSTIDLGPLLVEPRWGRRGHGSRLLAAAVDLARADGMIRATAWLPEADNVSRAFFASAGWSADGYARALDTGAGELREVRIHVSLQE